MSLSSHSTTLGNHYSTLPVDREPRLPRGTIVCARWEIVGELARGGMAVVYRAHDRRRPGHDVAIKVVTTDAHADAETALRYANEARLGASLAADPHVVRPLAVGALDAPGQFVGRMFLVTELIAGPSLAELLLGHPTGLPLERIVTIAADIARALASLHERGIVHRDVKPGNVIVEQGSHGDRAKLIDFGLAYATGDGWEAKSPDLTRDGHAPGTPMYMSPQQVAHERPTPAFDIYSLGVMLYEMVSGNPPHEGLPLEVLLARKLDPACEPFPIGKMCPQTPPALAQLIDRCLVYEARQRPSASAVVRALERLQGSESAADGLQSVAKPVGQAGIEPEAAAGVSRVVEPSRRLRPAKLSVVVLCVAAVSLWGVGMLWTHARDEGSLKGSELGAASLHTAPAVLAPISAADTPHEVPLDVPPQARNTSSLASSPEHPGHQAPGVKPVEPHAAPNTEPNERVASAPPVRSRPRGNGSKAQVMSCSERREQAEIARTRQTWSTVLRHTEDGECWSEANVQRQRLRVEALMGLGRWKACVQETLEAEDQDVIALGDECFRRVESASKRAASVKQ